MAWTMPEEVRTPRTVREGEAALDLIDASMASLETHIASKTRAGLAVDNLKRLYSSWDIRRTEIVYAITKLEAGAPATDSTHPQRVKELEAEVQQAREKISLLDRENASLLKQNRQLVQRYNEIQNMMVSEGTRAKLNLRTQKCYAFAMEAIQELIDRREVTPLVRLFLEEAEKSTPEAVLQDWRENVASHKRCKAEEKTR